MKLHKVPISRNCVILSHCAICVVNKYIYEKYWVCYIYIMCTVNIMPPQWTKNSEPEDEQILCRLKVIKNYVQYP